MVFPLSRICALHIPLGTLSPFFATPQPTWKPDSRNFATLFGTTPLPAVSGISCRAPSAPPQFDSSGFRESPWSFLSVLGTFLPNWLAGWWYVTKNPCKSGGTVRVTNSYQRNTTKHRLRKQRRIGRDDGRKARWSSTRPRRPCCPPRSSCRGVEQPELSAWGLCMVWTGKLATAAPE